MNGNDSELIAKAKDGDQSALSALYEQTYDQVYYTVRAMIRDEDDVFDILQDSYVKAFTHLDSFSGGEKFTAWVRRIAANTARDWLKKQKPLLFTELEQSNDTDIPVEDRFVDENTEHLPEYVIDRQETSRLIREILDELPADQRAAIGMYYYEEMSVKEIAAAMNVSENAVKSRLLYGRRKIEKKVRELEKKGTKLYGLSPILFLLWLLRGQKASAAEAPDPGILQNILESISSSDAPSGAAAAGRGFSAGRIIIAAAAAAAVIGGSIWLISGISKRQGPSETIPAASVTAESSAARSSAAETETVESREEPTAAPTPEASETETETETEAELTEASTTEEQDKTALWIEAEEAAGRVVLIGTVESMTYEQAVKLQGYPDYNAPDRGQTWVIIRLDAPQKLKGSQDVSSWEREYSVVLLWTRRSSGSENGEKLLNGYTGQHVICSAASFSLASDTSVPIGVPWARDLRIPETE